jgi:large subunit ribosomal protein L23
MKTYIIRRPIITERSLALANQDNTYSFEVDTAATKNQIQSQIEELYEVTVIRVRTIMKQPTARRTGKRRLASATRKSKKALVTLKAGQSIALFDVGGTA